MEHHNIYGFFSNDSISFGGYDQLLGLLNWVLLAWWQGLACYFNFGTG
jgi:hypothetical protein